MFSRGDEGSLPLLVLFVDRVAAIFNRFVEGSAGCGAAPYSASLPARVSILERDFLLKAK